MHVDCPALLSCEYSRLSSLGTLRSVLGAEECCEAAVFTRFFCTAYYSIHPQDLDGNSGRGYPRDNGGLLMYSRAFLLSQDRTDKT